MSVLRNNYILSDPFASLEKKKLKFVVPSTNSLEHVLLGDYKPFITVFYAKNISLQISKAALLCSSKVMIDFNKHEAYVQEKMAKHERYNEFDFNDAYIKALPQFVDKSIQFVATSIIRKMYELLSLLNLSNEITDKLTRDVTKYTKTLLAQTNLSKLYKIQSLLITTNWSFSLAYISLLTYDILYGVYQFFYSQYYGIKNDRNLKWDMSESTAAESNDSSNLKIIKKVGRSVKYVVLWVSKKSLFYTVCCVSVSAGTSVGSLSPVYPIMTGTVVGLVFEAVGSSVVNYALQLDD